ncbi:hypothetical protein T3A99_12425 [Pseudomonas sp. N-137]|uniref:hypothetical protein n=1 Tax=Pseudomonas sp. N-137 TaxID=3108452 RepID=UPI002ADEB8DC|nr:hypothetical protein [Pseudomonas sp. N-137]MEA1029373.1 hypothetical protein [Pseudomonas sp. N-137]
MHQALQAVRRYNKAIGVEPAAEIERLRLEAEAFMTWSEYLLRALGGRYGRFIEVVNKRGRAHCSSSGNWFSKLPHSCGYIRHTLKAQIYYR